MFLRFNRRRKDGKEHRYWNIVENKRCAGGKVVQRQVPADREVPACADGHGVQVRLDAMELHRPRQWGACWLACQLYEQLELDQFWMECSATIWMRRLRQSEWPFWRSRRKDDCRGATIMQAVSWWRAI
jgi:hypothetical protein